MQFYEKNKTTCIKCVETSEQKIRNLIPLQNLGAIKDVRKKKTCMCWTYLKLEWQMLANLVPAYDVGHIDQ